MDIKSLMRQAQEVQKKMQKIQDDLANSDFEGSAGGGMVKVVVSGAGAAKKIFIDESLINKDEKEILEDLLVAAFNDAKSKADEGSANSIKSATSGIPLPPGFKF
ncbi:MAG: YbaB/EbfC family nucleoid-associated protein [Rickettsiales bacterium]|nr:YbaB/EbfC family nucleoid-associated protein [Rickettsiales bacterium]